MHLRLLRHAEEREEHQRRTNSRPGGDEHLVDGLRPQAPLRGRDLNHVREVKVQVGKAFPRVQGLGSDDLKEEGDVDWEEKENIDRGEDH